MAKLEKEIYPYMFQLYVKMLNTDVKNKKLAAELSDFMKDKILCTDIQNNQNEWGLSGTYYVMEIDEWNVDSPEILPNLTMPKHFLLQKEGIHTSVDLREGQRLESSIRITVTDKKWKKLLIQNWKKYKKK